MMSNCGAIRLVGGLALGGAGYLESPNQGAFGCLGDGGVCQPDRAEGTDL